MPSYHLKFGFEMCYTAVIPPRAMDFIKKEEGKVAGFGLTPWFMAVPDGLVVGDIRRAGVEIPAHWEDTNVVWPIIHGVAFYIVPAWSSSLAVSLAMKGVNLRTGRQELPYLTDDPCQSYWSGPNVPPWIDGYRPSHAEGVRQFLPLRGDMSLDVARYVGVRPDNPMIDALTATFYLPADVRKLKESVVYRGGFEGLESKSVRSLSYGLPAVEEVGMGAGAVMKQRHPENPMAKPADYLGSPITMTTRLVWHEFWNKCAAAVGISPITVLQLRELEAKQKAYEANLWAHLNVPAVTDVDTFPQAY